MIDTHDQSTGPASTRGRAKRPNCPTLPRPSESNHQLRGRMPGDGLKVSDTETRPTRRVLLPSRESADVPVSARPTASGTESFPPLLADPPLRILVDDAMPPSTRTAGVTASAVAGLLSRMGIDTRSATSAGPEELLSRVKAAAPHYVMLVLHPGAQQSCPTSAADAWERPALLTRACHEAGVPVIALSIGGSAAALAACVGNGALAVLDIEQLPAALAHIAGAQRGNGGDIGGDGHGPGEKGHRRLPPTFEKLTHLTPTERRVLYHLTEGLPASDIARRMIVSLSTVRAHIRSILRKLDVGSQLAAVAIANGSEYSAGPPEMSS